MYYIYIKDWKFLASSQVEMLWLVYDSVLTVKNPWNYKFIDWVLQFITNIKDVDSTCFFVGVVDYNLIDQIDSEWEASKPGEHIEPGSNEIPVRNLQEYIDVLNIKKTAWELTQEQVDQILVDLKENNPELFGN